ncbi:glucokinase [Erythrobacter sp. SCSIO 43205]|uniref:glucokinase n=1 Tax=Erythrobacter sp. SCSIO 43205 TaxID=2779361 RepID=UPI001CA95642|nr:glucokinase [Erythrobacter sp. SCSIO 43205]UAB79840.1 glucokinase [Erythrobacter sp. SCSIO 43205]
MGGETQIVTVDIGGTHARFAIASIASEGTITLGEPVTLHTSNHASFQTAWEDFRSQQGGALPDNLAIAAAGRINADIIRFTNNPWIIRPPLIEEKLGVSTHLVINDFEAVAHAAAIASEDQFLHLAGPDTPLPSNGTISVLGPGTGLGVAHFKRLSPAKYYVQATEGGHGDFAPLDSIEDTILARLRQRHTRVSNERVVAGPAIVDIYQALAAMEGRAIVERSDVEIWTAGTNGEDSLAAAAVDRFCLALGSVAGDIALVQGASGVVIAGGLGYRIRETLLSSGFADRFCAKGRFASLMATLPVKLITHPQPGLLGAAAAFAQLHLEPQ